MRKMFLRLVCTDCKIKLSLIDKLTKDDLLKVAIDHDIALPNHKMVIKKYELIETEEVIINNNLTK